jgi:SAM-dependent methyltransferase
MKISKNSSHSKIARFLNDDIELGVPASILDIGCAKGELRDLITSNSVRYLGVEPFLADFQFALDKGLHVVNSTVEDFVAEINEKFDYIVLADVLEHLQDPTSILRYCHELLKPNGKVLISVPNVAHFSTRLTLLFGIWNYTDRGILDRTHLRFFTKKSFNQEINKCDFRYVKFMSTPIPLEVLFPNLNKHFFRFLDNMIYLPTLLYPKLFGYQHLWVIVPA